MERVKILLIDDNLIELNGIRSIISQFPNAEILAEFRDGEEAYRFILENKINIIITDIQMPGMTGLELIKKLKKQKVNSEIVIISNYGEFSYAQTAIDLGVSSYILKPINKKRFRSVLETLIEKIMAEKSLDDDAARYQCKLLYQQILFGMADEKAEAQKKIEKYAKENGYAYYCAMTFYIIYGKNVSAEYTRCIQNKIETMVSAFADEEIDIYSFKNVNNQINCIVCMKQSRSEFFLEEKLREFIKNINSEEKLWLKVGISMVSQNAKELRELYQQSIETALNYYSTSDIVFYKDDLKNTPEMSMVFVRKNVENILYGDINEVKSFVEKIIPPQYAYSRQTMRNTFEMIVRATELILETKGKSFKHEFGETFYHQIMIYENIIDIRQWLENFLLLCCQLNNEKDRYDKIINNIKIYIAENCSKRINLYELADRAEISKATLVKKFREKEGVDIKDYILSIKMEKAKKMLWEKKYKIYEISEAVGYKKRTQFYKLFKEYTGMTPSEYIEEHKKS